MPLMLFALAASAARYAFARYRSKYAAITTPLR